MVRIADYISKSAHHRPDEPAVTFEGRTFSWTQFEARCWAIAAMLNRLGVGHGDRVAFLGQNSHRQFECYLAPSRVGAISVPLNYRHAVAEMIECAADCTPSVLIVDRHFVDEARAIANACPSIQSLIYADDGPVPDGMGSYERLLAAEGDIDPKQFDDIASQDGDTVILFYTSGSTGTPKGVMLSHVNILSNAIGVAPHYGFCAEDTNLLSGPMFHLGSGSRVFTAVVYGAHTVVVPKFDVAEVLGAIQHHRISVVVWVPTMVTMILDHPKFDDFDLSSLRIINYGAAPMPIALIERAIAALPGIHFGQSYGMTEASPVLTILGPDCHELNGPLVDKLSSVGRPVPYVDIRVVDDAGNPVANGQTGEIVARGPQIMTGYWQQPERTAQAIRNGYYHTGDAGYIDDDGFVYLAGRVKEMIITGGENVYPIETENVLSHHPAIAECAVIGIPDELWGEAVHAVVRLKSDIQASEDELIAHCRDRLAHYKCPRAVTFRQEPLPLSATNKIMKSELRKPFLEGQPA